MGLEMAEMNKQVFQAKENIWMRGSEKARGHWVVHFNRSESYLHDGGMGSKVGNVRQDKLIELIQERSLNITEMQFCFIA